MRPLLDLLVVAERAGLLQQPVDQGRLAVVDVRDDRDVAQVHEMSGSVGRAVIIWNPRRTSKTTLTAQGGRRRPRTTA